MQDLGKIKGWAYAKFDYDPYKTYWVYSSKSSSSDTKALLEHYV